MTHTTQPTTATQPTVEETVLVYRIPDADPQSDLWEFVQRAQAVAEDYCEHDFEVWADAGALHVACSNPWDAYRMAHNLVPAINIAADRSGVTVERIVVSMRWHTASPEDALQVYDLLRASPYAPVFRTARRFGRTSTSVESTAMLNGGAIIGCQTLARYAAENFSPLVRS